MGLNLKSTKKDSPLLPALQKEMARRGYLVFRGQGVLSGDEQVRCYAKAGVLMMTMAQ